MTKCHRTAGRRVKASQASHDNDRYHDYDLHDLPPSATPCD